MKTLAELKESGIITEEESEASKSKLSDQLVQDETTVAPSNTTEDITPEDIKCPKCGSEMVVRPAKKGPNVDCLFHVCSRYPACKGSIAIE